KHNSNGNTIPNNSCSVCHSTSNETNNPAKVAVPTSKPSSKSEHLAGGSTSTNTTPIFGSIDGHIAGTTTERRSFYTVNRRTKWTDNVCLPNRMDEIASADGNDIATVMMTVFLSVVHDQFLLLAFDDYSLDFDLISADAILLCLGVYKVAVVVIIVDVYASAVEMMIVVVVNAVCVKLVML
uniref:Uncharacterized protein n=1 Tax=Glossina palpalis gambiensis TaxID=67801 RepID=A0A1B0AKN5_9MUSC